MVMKNDNNEILIEFWNGQELMTVDRLFQYDSLIIDEQNHQKCTLQSSAINRILIFPREADISKFLSILSKDGVLIPNSTDQYTFRIIRPHISQNNLLGIVGAIRNTFKSEIDPNKIRPVDGFTFGTIEQQLPTTQFARFTIDDATNSKLESLLFSSISIPIEAYPIIFKRLLKISTEIDIQLSTLMKLKKQWELTTYSEWNHHCELRIFVHDVEQWIESNCSMSSELHRKLLFHIAITLFTDSFGSLRFSKQFMFVIRLMLFSFISDNCNDDSFIANNGTGLTFEEAENSIYWLVKPLWTTISKSKLSSLQESLSIRTALSGISPSTLKMLNDHSVSSLEFAFNEADYFFSYGKKRSEMLLMVAAAIASNDLNGFRRNGILASLILLQEKLQTINDVNSFISGYSTELRKLDSRLLLYNIERLFASGYH